MGKKNKNKVSEDSSDEDAVFDSLETTLMGETRGNFKNLGNLDIDKKVSISTRVHNDIARSEKKSEKRANSKGKEARATIEQVLDPRTRLILFKLMGVGFLTQIDGCLSTGKEANVYYAKGENGKEYAVKIFKTSILVFKDRDKYVSGEYRFRHGYCRSNPRKMVKVWAEKEMRNLKRLQMAGLPSPAPQILKSHVLIMDFLGENGWCAPRLKDAQLSFEELHESYRICVVMMRILLHDCGLIHGDFSEYNLLYHKKEICVIDVSQSVEISHPLSLEFLRKDISNINDFFGRRGVYTLHKMDVFAYITNDPGQDYREDKEMYPSGTGQTDEEIDILRRDRHRKKWRSDLDAAILAQYRQQQGIGQEDLTNAAEAKREVEEAVFMRSFIPTRLDDIPNPMQEMKRLQNGQREMVFSSAISTMLAQTTIGAVGPVNSSTKSSVQQTQVKFTKAGKYENDNEEEDNNDIRDYVYTRQNPDDEDEYEEEEENLAKLALYEEAEALAAEDGEEDEEDEYDETAGDEEEDAQLKKLINMLKPPSSSTSKSTDIQVSHLLDREEKVINNKLALPPSKLTAAPGSLVASILANVRNALTLKQPLTMTSSEVLQQWKRPTTQKVIAEEDDEDDENTEKKMDTISKENQVQKKVKTADSDSDDEDNSENEEDSDEESSGEDGSYDEKTGKYRRQLPSHDNPEDRLRAKEARKEAAKAQKEAKKLKRQTAKIPKHVKKRATTRNKK